MSCTNASGDLCIRRGQQVVSSGLPNFQRMSRHVNSMLRHVSAPYRVGNTCFTEAVKGGDAHVCMIWGEVLMGTYMYV